MKKFTGAGIALLLGTTAAYAGGMDRSGQSIAALFEEGTYAEISFGSITADVTGAMRGVPSSTTGDVAPDYTTFGLAFKTDINDKVSLAFIMDEPFGASISYTGSYTLAGGGTEVTSTGITVLGQYHIDENFSVYAGPRIISAEGIYNAPTVLGGYSSTYSKGSDTGYVVGAAYEIPEIALRAAVTYSSATELLLEGTIGDANAKIPQSVNIDLQSGIAPNTLAFASVRWADWSEAEVTDSALLAQSATLGVLTDFRNRDTYSYSLGVGRKFSENFSGIVSVGYEETSGQEGGQLSATDGYTSLSIGGAYTFENGMELSGGVRKVWLGDAITEPVTTQGGVFPGSSFTDNTATAIGLKLAYNY
ncbi:transporter [Paradonghicola geojensis]|nr:transporter [Marivivens geojensis]